MTVDHSRDPCPYSIVNDVGVGFCMGAIGGSVWHGFKGYRNSPRGERFTGSLASIKARAPVIGGNFAVWSGLFNAGDCTIAHVRGKEDAWNPILAGTATGAILAARSGPKVMAISAVFGGAILAAMEGVGAMINRMNSDTYKPQAPPLPELPAGFQPETAQQQLAVLGGESNKDGNWNANANDTASTLADPYQQAPQQAQQQPQQGAQPSQPAQPQRRGLFGFSG
ncbi:Tim17/Tim22/Tim23/Pmp24 family-domain-containing protein [Fimicolochytrium jonesii]|uniref:Tim17/Tim22/Tim23/Pmp24 family-domain-containing protein n=1 Tax=Fimicolochytrium jonesii TaxID=1396493 RepID=UPI0022FE5B38|nr:Tim17/Tim22/Tim23/Pmp24 family-domain-containing protein [Fimicolochytrium jonesii]KAI8819822.1 Tim17/Tim22/Tim23/Pmp24 family-domain-containing protein [Fimicolochytrium jonesii]